MQGQYIEPSSASFPGSPLPNCVNLGTRHYKPLLPSLGTHAQWKVGWGLRMTFDLLVSISVPEVQVQLLTVSRLTLL